MDTKQLEYAWSAGFIDADGTITIKRTRRGKDQKWYYIPYIAVSQSDKVGGRMTVERLQKLFGGNIYYWTSTQNMKLLDGSVTQYRRNNTVNWQITSSGAIKCLEYIYPYLVTKNNQGGILQRFIKECFTGVQGKRISEQENIDREKLFNEMRVFNVKGFAPTTTKRKDSKEMQ